MPIGFDTETTGLPKPKAAALNLHPEIVEFAGIKYDKDFNEIGRLEFLCRPKLTNNEMPTAVYKVHGISWADVADKPPFEAYYKQLAEFFLGEEICIAHNAPFDIYMLWVELTRMGVECKFPWPMIHHCTMQMAEEIGGFAKKSLGAIYEQLFQCKIENQHRATSDVEAMIKIYTELLKRNSLKATPRVG